MRVLLCAFAVFFLLFFRTDEVNAQEYTADNEQIWLEDTETGWKNEPKIRIGVELEDNISDIKASIGRNGVYFHEQSIDLEGQASSYIWEIILDEQAFCLEGVTEWFVKVTDLSGNSYIGYFQIKMDFTPPVISTDIFGDFGYEVMFDYREGVRVWAVDDVSGVDYLKVNPSKYQNLYVNEKLTPYMSKEAFEINFLYPKDESYGYVITARDLAGNLSSRVIITRYNVTGRMKRIIPRGNYGYLYSYTVNKEI